MTTLAQLLTICRTDVLNDAGSTQRYSDALLTRWLNEGIGTLFPRLHVPVTDATTRITATTPTSGQVYVNQLYALPSGVPTYPQLLSVRKVEVGPVGGYKVADAENQSDTWLVLKAPTPNRLKAWEVDDGARKLQVNLSLSGYYDSSDTFRYYLRIHYVREPAALSASTDTFEGPKVAEDYLGQYVRLRAIQYQQIRRTANVEQSRILGSMVAQQGDDLRELWRRFPIRMILPPLVR